VIMAQALSTIYRPNPAAVKYSGVVIEVDSGGEEVSPAASALVTTPIVLREHWWYQTLHLPESYGRGTEPRFPSLTGFQLLVAIEEGRETEAELNYRIQQYLFGSGWTTRAEGTAKGCHADGPRVWMDILLDEEIEIDSSMVPNPSKPKSPTEFRLGFQKVTGVEKVWYTEPNPYAHGEAELEEGPEPEATTKEREVEESLLKHEGKYAINFRLLGLTADSGTDFLGDPYRSAVVRSSAEAPSGENTNAGYWLSGPQPSRFAVVSHYSDVRPTQRLAKYGNVNLVANPSFEYDLVEGLPGLWTTGETYWTIPGAKPKIRRWRGIWFKEETYAKGVSVLASDGKSYTSLANGNKGHNPVGDGGVHWVVDTTAFAPPQGQQYLEVKT
jgi:hypothetical protein